MSVKAHLVGAAITPLLLLLTAPGAAGRNFMIAPPRLGPQFRDFIEYMRKLPKLLAEGRMPT